MHSHGDRSIGNRDRLQLFRGLCHTQYSFLLGLSPSDFDHPHAVGPVFSAAFSQAPPSSQGLQSMGPREPLSFGTASICFCVHAQLGACWWQGMQVGLKAQGVQVQGCDANGRLRTEGYGWLSLATINFGPQQHCLTTWRPIQTSASSKLRSVFQGDPHPALLTSKSPQERAAGWPTSPSVGRSGWNMPGATTRGLQMHLQMKFDSSAGGDDMAQLPGQAMEIGWRYTVWACIANSAGSLASKADSRLFGEVQEVLRTAELENHVNAQLMGECDAGPPPCYPSQ